MTTEIEANKRTVDEIATEIPTEVSAEKKQKSSCNLDALKKQIEYYMSDANLKHDKFFHTKMSETPEGWLSITNVLACNKVRTLTTSPADVAEAVKMSNDVEVNEAKDSIRRKSPLPVFEGEAKRSTSLKSGKDKHPAIHRKQFVIGEFKFPNLTAAKKRVGEILKSRKSGVIFKEGTPDYNLVIAILKEHPNAAVKMEGMTGIKVDTAPQGESRCFFIAKGEAKDVFEDISIVKAFVAIENRLIGSFETVKSSSSVAAVSAPVAEESSSEEKEIEEVAEEVAEESAL